MTDSGQADPAAGKVARNASSAYVHTPAARRARASGLHQFLDAVPVALLTQDLRPVLELLATLRTQGVKDVRRHARRHPDIARQARDIMRITAANEAAVVLFGAGDAQRLLASIEQIFVPESNAVILKELIALAENRQELTFETVLGTLTGQSLEASISARWAPDEPRHAVISIIDISERKRAQREREQLRARERHAWREAQRANIAKDEFLANLSHELRTPLNAILGWTQVLQREASPDDLLVRALAAVERSARTQAELVDDLLALADIVAGRLRLDVREMTLAGSLRAAVASLRPAIEAKGIRFEARLDDHARVILGDPGRLQQIAWNLLSNAVKFTPPGGCVRLTSSCTASGVEIVVSDTGEGIPSQSLPHVFEDFWQGDGSSRRRHGGLGLGLSIVRHLVELHGGTIVAESQGEGRGATFRVSLPVLHPADNKRALNTPRRTGGATAARVSGARIEGMRILFVDDDANTREMLYEVLRRAGADVEAAGCAAEALEKLQRWLPDVLISDIGMPGEDGYDLLRQIRQLPEELGGGVPAIALTGYARERDRLSASDAGYQAFAAKPVDLDQLFTTITRLAGGERSRNCPPR